MSPGHWSPVVKFAEDGQLELHTMKWGLVPSFTKAGEKPDHFRMFNARSETVPEKGIFKRLLSRQRCVVLLNGFYEWAKEHKQKQPYYIYLEGDVTKMAGLFDCWAGAEGEPLYTFTIMTTDSSTRLSWLHDRMPVILHSSQDEQRWLSNEDVDVKSFASICEPFNGEELKWHPVATAMSNMRYQGDDCAKELKKGNIATFFKPKKVSEAPVDKASPPKACSKPTGLQQQAVPPTQPAAKPEDASQSDRAQSGPAAQPADNVEDMKQPAAASGNKADTGVDEAKMQVKQEEKIARPSQPVDSPKSQKRPASQPGSSPTKKQKQLPRGQGQISAFFSPNSK